MEKTDKKPTKDRGKEKAAVRGKPPDKSLCPANTAWK